MALLLLIPFLHFFFNLARMIVHKNDVKARKTVHGYIGFTILVIILMLACMLPIIGVPILLVLIFAASKQAIMKKPVNQ